MNLTTISILIALVSIEFYIALKYDSLGIRENALNIIGFVLCSFWSNRMEAQSSNNPSRKMTISIVSELLYGLYSASLAILLLISVSMRLISFGTKSSYAHTTINLTHSFYHLFFGIAGTLIAKYLNNSENIVVVDENQYSKQNNVQMSSAGLIIMSLTFLLHGITKNTICLEWIVLGLMQICVLYCQIGQISKSINNLENLTKQRMQNSFSSTSSTTGSNLYTVPLNNNALAMSASEKQHS